MGLIRELNKEICSFLGLDKPWQFELSETNDLAGHMRFAKENLDFPGTKLDLIKKGVINFYSSRGFVIKETKTNFCEFSSNSYKESILSSRYTRSSFLTATRGSENYDVFLYSGDEYNISVFPGFNLHLIKNLVSQQLLKTL